MGILHPNPKLEPGEQVLWGSLANRVTGPSAAFLGLKSSAGGRLAVTDRRVLFQPSRVDALLLEKRWELPLESVEGFEVVGREATEIVAGGMRERLGIRTEEGVEVFVVNRLEKKIAQLRNLIP